MTDTDWKLEAAQELFDAIDFNSTEPMTYKFVAVIAKHAPDTAALQARNAALVAALETVRPHNFHVTEDNAGLLRGNYGMIRAALQLTDAEAGQRWALGNELIEFAKTEYEAEDGYCFFCEMLDGNDHKPDCLHKRALALTDTARKAKG